MSAPRPAGAVVRGVTPVGPFRQAWEEQGRGRPVLLVHGINAGASRLQYRDLVPRLAAGFRVRAADLLGFGDSDHPDLEYTPGVVLAAVRALVDDMAADGEAPLVVATSLTGAYATRAVTGGARAAGLVLVTPTGLGGTQTRRSGRLGAALYALGRHTPLGDAFNAVLGSAPSVAVFLKGPAYGDASKVTDDVVSGYVRSARRPNAKYAALAFVTNRLALRLTASKVARVPTLVLWGAAEGFTDTAEADAWRRAGADVVVMAGVGLPPAERPDEVAERIRAFAAVAFRSDR